MTYTPPAELVPANVVLEGLDGNAFSIIGAVQKGLRKAGNPPELIDQVRNEMMSGDYDHLLQVAMAVVEQPFAGEED